jgi:general secretion pathway protein L
MTTAEMIQMTKSFGSDLAVKMSRWGRLLWKILTFSLADDRIAPRRCLSIVMETGGVSFVYRSRFLFHEKKRETRRYPAEAGKYPAPENLAAATALAAGELKAAGAQITLVIPRAWAILKTTEFPLTVKKNLSNVVSFELDRLTPLSSERALFDFLILGEDENRIRIMLAAMKAETLQPYMEALRERGIAVGRVALAIPGEPGHDSCGKEGIRTGGMNLLDQGVYKTQKTPMALTILLLAVLIASGLFWMVSPLQLEQKRVEAIDREIAARRDEVKKVEALKKEIEEVRKERAVINGFRTSRPITLDLLKELTRVLPDSAWLSRVRCTETTVDIEGYAASATDILPKLENSGYFKKVEFASPTLRDARLNADRFVIKMEIEGLPEAKTGNENK